ncbi:MAG: hypothetical protein JF602_02665 [Gemmatimonadetes bacterium]|nr:hypothetical protein [Gemmatimonadota bacterium]
MKERALPMYLVDLGSGEETLFRSGNELAEAIRCGIVGEQSRIYHRARATWLPITVHPEYRRATAEHPAAPRMPSRQRQWTFMRGEEADATPVPLPDLPTQEVIVLPPASRSWRQSLGSAFRFWGKGRH